MTQTYRNQQTGLAGKESAHAQKIRQGVFEAIMLFIPESSRAEERGMSLPTQDRRVGELERTRPLRGAHGLVNLGNDAVRFVASAFNGSH